MVLLILLMYVSALLQDIQSTPGTGNRHGALALPPPLLSTWIGLRGLGPVTAGVLERWPDVDGLVQQDVGDVPELPAGRELADVREQLLGLEPGPATLVLINLLPSWLPSPPASLPP